MTHSQHSSFDILIAGAGPSGSTAAFHLARAGLKVAVLDQCSFPRYKVCGGGVVLRALRCMPVPIDGVIETSCHEAELLHHHPDLHFRTTRAAPIVSMVMRDRLDALLLEAARDAGTQVFTGCRVVSLRQKPGWVEFETDRFRLRGRFGIGADGARSKVAGLAGWEPSSALAPALECEIRVDRRAPAVSQKAARFDFGLVESGYGWSFPKGENLSVGVFSLKPRRCNLNEALKVYLRVLGVASRIRSFERHGAVLPMAPRKGGLTRGRILLVGDAAGLADPITGEGLSFAVESGRLAATALLQGALEERAVSELYPTVLRDIREELRIGRLLAPLLYSFPGARAVLFRLYGDALCEALTDVFMGRKTYRSILSNPRNYLRLLGFGIGASSNRHRSGRSTGRVDVREGEANRRPESLEEPGQKTPRTKTG